MSRYWSSLDNLMDAADNVPYFGMGVRALGTAYKTRNNAWYVLDKSYSKARKIYRDTSLDTYVWRAHHSNDWLLGRYWAKANARDLYNEKVGMQNDRKKNLGYYWKDNAYPRTAYSNAFGNSAGFANSSPIFDVNKSILELYNGVSKW